jgi:peroxiredoxin
VIANLASLALDMERVQPGDPAPDVTLMTLEGKTVPLAETWRGGRHVLLVFLRHLG